MIPRVLDPDPADFKLLGEPIAGEEVQFIWKSEMVGMAITENDGDFSFNYPVSLDTSLGNLSWAVNFNGNYFYKNSSSSQLVEVYQQTVINFQIDKTHFYAGYEFLVSGNLSMDNGTLFGGNLVFYFDNLDSNYHICNYSKDKIKGI